LLGKIAYHYGRASGPATSPVKSLADTLVGNPALASRSKVASACGSRSRSVPRLPRADHLVRHRLGWPRKQGAQRPERTGSL